jgi:tetratricopeptide (TPR) repeat protein
VSGARPCPQRARLTLHAIADIAVIAAAGLMPTFAAAQADPGPCGDPFANGTGPWDYRSEPPANKRLVENYHFTSNVETLIRPQSAGALGSDIDYTLRAFPNHHRALIAMTALGARLKSAQPEGAQFSVECYFQRAIRFRADDGLVRMLYAKFLYAQKRPADAARQLEAADEIAADNGFSHYNIGLIYLEARQFDAALAQAQQALALGFTRPELKNALVAAGRWVEPVAAAPASASSPVSAAPR